MTSPPPNRVVISCAGSGKTRMLIERLLCLLKSGAAPGEILALTFTNKAAAEIRARLLDEMAKIPELAACRNRILLAAEPRDIFAAQTFHGWFLSLLRLSPWREGKHYGAPSPVADEGRRFDEAWRRWRRRAEREIHPPLKTVLAELPPYSLRALCEEFLKNRNLWALRPQPAEGKPAAPEKQNRALQNAAREFAKNANGEGVNFSRAQQTAMQLAEEKISPAEAESAFFSAEGAPRKALQTNAQKCGYAPLLENVLFALKEYLRAEDQQRAEEFNAAACAVYEDFDREWRAVLAARNEITFDELELRAREMLRNEKTREEISRRLYVRYRHVLIDEFQDTGPLQWQIMRGWLKDAHGTDEERTVFIVGDPKQAIYGFRKGDSRLLGEAQTFLEEYYGVQKEPPQNTCHRCARNILTFINAAFDENKLPEFAAHQPGENNGQIGGRVEWHPYFAARKAAPKTRIRNPLTAPPAAADNAPEIRAAAVAEKIREILQHWQLQTPAGARPCRPEDIIILSPQLTHAAAQTNALAAKNIPCAVSGGGRNFLDSFECGDILDLAAALLSPERNYSLARVLKSPLFSLDDNLLAELAGGAADSLWDNLQNYSGNAPEAKRARILLKLWQRRAQTQPLPAHDFLSRILLQANAAARYQAAVPPPLQKRVRDNLAKLLDFSLLAEGGARPMLAQFLEETQNGANAPPESGGVRHMSIHAAKGLQAPVIVLAGCDFSHSGGRGNSVDILADWPPGKDAPARFAASLRRRRRAYSELKKNAQQLKEQEQANLLYVAATRAQHALIIFSPAEPKGAAAWPLAAMQKLLPGQHPINPNTPLVFGDDLCAAAQTENPPAEPAANITPLGRREPDTAAAARGAIRHKILALLLSGIPPEKARQFTAAEPEQWKEAEKMAAAPPLQKIIKNAHEILTEREFAMEQQIIRPDLVVLGEESGQKIAWIIDYKTAARPEIHRPQLESYRRAVAACYPEYQTRLAILDIRGKMHFLVHA